MDSERHARDAAADTQGASAGCTATPDQLAANKRLANEFWRVGITPPERIGLVDAGYVQHNPTLHRFALENKMSDYQTLMVFATRAGAQRAPQPIRAANRQTLTAERPARLVAACDVVMQIHMGYLQNPAGVGQLGRNLQLGPVPGPQRQAGRRRFSRASPSA